LDLFDSQKDSPFDKLVQNGCLQKSLETDHVLYIDGDYHGAYDSNTKPDFVNSDEIDYDYKLRCQETNYSAGDYQEEFDDNFQMRDDGLAPELGVFETNNYFDKLYPALKI